MSARNTYTRPMAGWYRTNPYFVKYMLRESTAVFFVVYVLILLAGVIALSRGAAAYAGWLDFVSNPLIVLLHVMVLAAAAYHTYTWFKVSPKAAPPVRVRGKPLPDAMLIGSQYAAMAIASIAIVALAAWV